MVNKKYKELMAGDQFKYNGGIWIKTAPKRKGCCGSPLLYNGHMVGNRSVHKIFQPEENLEMYKENKPVNIKNTAKTDKTTFSILSEGDLFVFSGGKVVFRKVDGASCIDEDGKVVRLRPSTTVYHIHEPKELEEDNVEIETEIVEDDISPSGV